MSNDEGETILPIVGYLSQTMKKNVESATVPLPFSYPVSPPFGQFSVSKTQKEMADVVGQLIPEHLNKNNTGKQDLVNTFKSNFE